MKGIIRIDSYYIRVQQLLRDHGPMREDLERRLAQLRHDLADVPASVCLRPYPMDVQVIPGSPDPEGKLWGNIEQIKRDTRACMAEIRQVEGELREIDRLLAYLKRKDMDGAPGRVLRWLYIDRMTWEWVQDQGIVRSEISRYRKIGIEKLANKLYSRIRADINNPN